MPEEAPVIRAISVILFWIVLPWDLSTMNLIRKWKCPFADIQNSQSHFFTSSQFNAYLSTYLLPMGGSYLRKQTGTLASAHRRYNPQFPKPAFPWNYAQARWQQLKLNSTIAGWQQLKLNSIIARWQQLKHSTSKVATIETQHKQGGNNWNWTQQLQGWQQLKLSTSKAHV